MCGGAENRRTPTAFNRSLQFPRKDQIGQLGLRICLEHRLIDALALQIIELNFRLDQFAESDTVTTREPATGLMDGSSSIVKANGPR